MQAGEAQPALLRDGGMVRLWHKPDPQFKVPKAVLYLHLQLPGALSFFYMCCLCAAVGYLITAVLVVEPAALAGSGTYSCCRLCLLSLLAGSWCATGAVQPSEVRLRVQLQLPGAVSTHAWALKNAVAR